MDYSSLRRLLNAYEREVDQEIRKLCFGVCDLTAPARAIFLHLNGATRVALQALLERSIMGNNLSESRPGYFFTQPEVEILESFQFAILCSFQTEYSSLLIGDDGMCVARTIHSLVSFSEKARLCDGAITADELFEISQLDAQRPENRDSFLNFKNNELMDWIISSREEYLRGLVEAPLIPVGINSTMIFQHIPFNKGGFAVFNSRKSSYYLGFLTSRYSPQADNYWGELIDHNLPLQSARQTAALTISEIQGAIVGHNVFWVGVARTTTTSCQTSVCPIRRASVLAEKDSFLRCFESFKQRIFENRQRIIQLLELKSCLINVDLALVREHGENMDIIDLA